jgi:hypothetical protein
MGRWFKKQFGKLLSLPEYFRALAKEWLNILFGETLVGIVFLLWWSLANPPNSRLIAVFVVAMFLAGYYAWRAEYIRLEPKLSIIELVRDEWDIFNVPEANEHAILWYFKIKNISEGLTVRNISVQLNQIEPVVNDLDWLPINLHLKHDNPMRVKDYLHSFDLNPGETKAVDFVSAIVGQHHFSIEHVLRGRVNNRVRNGRYRLEVIVTAQNLPPLLQWLDVRMDGELRLQCWLEN